MDAMVPSNQPCPAFQPSTGPLFHQSGSAAGFLSQTGKSSALEGETVDPEHLHA
jgi:hypothetical protein